MARHFDNFIEAYAGFRKDGFVPDKFHYWTAISIVAGALERKVWVPWSPMTYYANMFVLLVSKPGIGKSSAINPGVQMLRKVNSLHQNMNILPSKITEAKLFDLMAKPKTFEYNKKIFQHCSGYYHASEASSDLKDITGSSGLIPTITGLYDCPPEWEKATIGMGDKTNKIINGCFNLLAGCTYDYLGKLVTDENIAGGFASRCMYVMQSEKLDRESKWGGEQNTKAIDQNMYGKLVEDLQDVHNMVGPFRAEPELQEVYFEWFKKFDQEMQQHPSEKIQTLMTRKQANAIKLAMILSAAESSSKYIKVSHWHRALELVDETYKDLPMMIRESRSRKTTEQTGLNAAFINMLLKQPYRKMHYGEMQTKLTMLGFDPAAIEKTRNSLLQDTGAFRIEGEMIALVGDPDHYL